MITCCVLIPTCYCRGRVDRKHHSLQATRKRTKSIRPKGGEERNSWGWIKCKNPFHHVKRGGKITTETKQQTNQNQLLSVWARTSLPLCTRSLCCDVYYVRTVYLHDLLLPGLLRLLLLLRLVLDLFRDVERSPRPGDGRRQTLVAATIATILVARYTVL